MEVNPNPFEDTSIPYHDFSVLESIAKYFYTDKRTGAEAVAEVWKQIADGKLNQICTELAISDVLGFIHGVNTLGKNLCINGYLDKQFNEEAWIDYRFAHYGYGKLSLEMFVRDGFTIVKNAVSKELLDEYESAYAEEIQNSFDDAKSYLENRFEFNKSKEIVNIICSDFVNEFCKLVNGKYLVQMVEARMGSSRISWHVDDPLTEDSPASPNMFGVLVALGNHDERAGLFHISPESHKFNIDKNVVNKENLEQRSNECFEYFHGLVNSAKRSPFRFVPRRGDAIIWHGKSIHAGMTPNTDDYPQHIRESLPAPKRHSIISHYVRLPEFGSGVWANAKIAKENSKLFLAGN